MSHLKSEFAPQKDFQRTLKSWTVSAISFSMHFRCVSKLMYRAWCTCSITHLCDENLHLVETQTHICRRICNHVNTLNAWPSEYSHLTLARFNFWHFCQCFFFFLKPSKLQWVWFVACYQGGEVYMRNNPHYTFCSIVMSLCYLHLIKLNRKIKIVRCTTCTQMGQCISVEKDCSCLNKNPSKYCTLVLPMCLCVVCVGVCVCADMRQFIHISSFVFCIW